MQQHKVHRVAPTSVVLQKNRRKSGENLIHNSGWRAFQAFPVSCFQIQGARLITAHNSRCASACAFKWYGKARSTGKNAASGNRHNNRHLSCLVELIRGNHQNRTCSLLFMFLCRIKGNEVNISAPHQISSRPLGAEAVHWASAPAVGAEMSHWASNSCREYRFLVSGSTIRRPFSTAMFTAAPDCNRTIFNMAGGTASITEPPTFLRCVENIPASINYIFI